MIFGIIMRVDMRNKSLFNINTHTRLSCDTKCVPYILCGRRELWKSVLLKAKIDSYLKLNTLYDA